MTVKTTDPAQFLIESARHQGVACATVDDGHVIIFTRAHLELLMKSLGDKNECVVFIKRTDFNG